MCAGTQHGVPAVRRELLKAPLELQLTVQHGLHRSGSHGAGQAQVLERHCLLAQAHTACQGWAVALAPAAAGRRFVRHVLPAPPMRLHCDLQVHGC